MAKISMEPNALIFEFSNAAGLEINPATPLPGGLSFGLQGGFFNRYAITGTLSSPTLVETTVGVLIQTFGGQCVRSSLRWYPLQSYQHLRLHLLVVLL